MKLSLKYLFLSLTLFVIELMIALFLHDNVIRAHVGDILVVVLIYCFLRIFIRKEIKLLPLYIFLFAAAVEVLQYFHIASMLHLEEFSVLRVIVGSTFDWADILAYLTGAAVSGFLQWLDAKGGKLVIPIFAISIIISMATFSLLAYNGLWWPVNPESMGYRVKGIDVARYQGNIDWKAIREENIRFAYIKATEGASYQDPLFTRNITESKRNGVVNGAYHYFSPDSPGAAQAANFIATVSPYQTDMPPVLDFEIGPAADKENVVGEVKIYLREIQAFFGAEPIIYTTYESYGLYLSDNFTDYKFWIRDLLRKPSFDGNLVLWQYCNRGRLRGIDKAQKYVDLNVFIGTEQEFTYH